MMSQWGLHLFFVTEIAGHAQGADDVPPAHGLALTGCIKNASGLNDVHKVIHKGARPLDRV